MKHGFITSQPKQKNRPSSSDILTEEPQVQADTVSKRNHGYGHWDQKGCMPTGTTIKAQFYCETLKKPGRAIQNRIKDMFTKGMWVFCS